MTDETETTDEIQPDNHAPTSTDERSHSPAVARPGDAADEAHGARDHGDEHGHDAEALGPVDVQAWGALILGVALGMVVVVGVAISTSA